MSIPSPLAHEAAYEAFWNDVTSGAIVPGEQLSEEGLSLRWNISRMPVREALVRLETEGLVERRHRVGTFVRQVDAGELGELQQLRSVIEGLVLRRVARIATEEQLDRLEKLAVEVDAFEYSPDLKAAVQAESRFHMAMVEISGLRHAARILKLQRLYVRSFHLVMSLSPAPTQTGASSKHQDLVALLRARDGNAAAALHSIHLLCQDENDDAACAEENL